MTGKENSSLLSNLDNRTRAPKSSKFMDNPQRKFLNRYLEAIAANEADIGVTDYVRLFNASFSNDSVEVNCKRLQLIRVLDKDIQDRFTYLNKVLDSLLDSYRFLKRIVDTPIASSSSVSPTEEESERINEFVYYFRQWFKHLCRVMLSLCLLQENKSNVSLPKDELNWKCFLFNDPKKTPFTVRSVHCVDTMYKQAVTFFQAKVPDTLDNYGHLRIDPISQEISDMQRYVAGFMENVRGHIQHLNIQISKYNVTTKDTWRFLPGSKTLPTIQLELGDKSIVLTYDNKTPLSSFPYTDSAKFRMVENRSDMVQACETSRGALVPPKLPELSPTTPVASTNDHEVRTSVSERKRKLEQEGLVDPHSLTEIMNEATEAVPRSYEDQGRGSTIIMEALPTISDKVATPEAAVEEDLWPEGNDADTPFLLAQQEQQQQELETAQSLCAMTLFGNKNEEDIWDSKDEEDNISSTQRLKRRSTKRIVRSTSTKYDDTKLESEREAMIMDLPVNYFREDQTIAECFAVTKSVLKDTIIQMYDVERKAAYVMRQFLRNCVRQKIASMKMEKSVMQLNFSAMIIDLYNEVRLELKEREQARIALLTPEQQRLIFLPVALEGRKKKMSQWERWQNRTYSRVNRHCLSVACSMWDEICDDFFSNNPLIVDQLLSIEETSPSNQDWQKVKEEIKEADFFQLYDVVQFANQIKNAVAGKSSTGTMKLLIRLLDIDELDEDIAFERILSTAAAKFQKPDPVISYKGTSSAPKKRRIKYQQRGPLKRKRTSPSPKRISPKPLSRRSSPQLSMRLSSSTLSRRSSPQLSSRRSSPQLSTSSSPKTSEEKIMEEEHEEEVVSENASVVDSIPHDTATLDEVLNDFALCCSKSFDHLGMELTMPAEWPFSTYCNFSSIEEVIADVVQHVYHLASGLEFDEAKALEMIKSKFEETLPLVMIIDVKDRDKLFNATPPNGRCHYLLHYQLFKRAAQDYKLPIKQVNKYLISQKEFDDFVEQLQHAHDYFEEAIKTCEDEELKIKMNSLMIKILNVIEFERNNKGKDVFMSRGEVAKECVGGYDRWGGMDESAILFFAQEPSYSMALFRTMNNVFKFDHRMLINRSKYEHVKDDCAVYVTSTNNISQVSAPHVATVKQLIEASKGLNFGCFDGVHFYPLDVKDTEDHFIQRIRDAYNIFCYNFLKLFLKLDKNEMRNFGVEQLREYRERAMDKRRQKKLSSVIDLSPAPPTSKKASPPSSKLPCRDDNIILEGMESDINSLLTGTHTVEEWQEIGLTLLERIKVLKK